MPNEEHGTPLLARLGLSGKLLMAGGLIGVLAVYMPLISSSVEMMGMKAENSARVIDDWRGKVCLAGYIVAVILAFLLYPPKQKGLCWAAIGVGLALLGLAFWLALLHDTGASDVGFARAKTSLGLGGILNILAGAAVAAGGFLKAREEGLV